MWRVKVSDSHSLSCKLLTRLPAYILSHSTFLLSHNFVASLVGFYVKIAMTFFTLLWYSVNLPNDPYNFSILWILFLWSLLSGVILILCLSIEPFIAVSKAIFGILSLEVFRADFPSNLLGLLASPGKWKQLPRVLLACH